MRLAKNNNNKVSLLKPNNRNQTILSLKRNQTNIYIFCPGELQMSPVFVFTLMSVLKRIRLHKTLRYLRISILHLCVFSRNFTLKETLFEMNGSWRQCFPGDSLLNVEIKALISVLKIVWSFGKCFQYYVKP